MAGIKSQYLFKALFITYLDCNSTTMGLLSAAPRCGGPEQGHQASRETAEMFGRLARVTRVARVTSLAPLLATRQRAACAVL